MIQNGSNIHQVCQKIHKDFVTNFKHAKVKGKSAKFDWQLVGVDHIVHDKDIIEIGLR